MSIESYVAARLLAASAIVSHLASYTPPGGSLTYPGIFMGIAPSDADPGWTGNVQYPRLTFQVFRSMTTEQTLHGTIHVQIWTRETDTSQLRPIQNAVMACLNSAPLLTDEGLIVCEFAAATPFKQEQEKATAVLGVDLAFNFDAYVSQTTIPPDPIAALAGFVVHHLSSSIQVLPTETAATDSAPLLYWRVVGDTVGPRDELRWGEWHTITARGHVMCPGAYARLNWAVLIARNLAALPNRRLALNDGSPLRIQSVKVDQQANPNSQGQVVVEAKYGTLAGGPTAFTNPPIDPITGTSGSGSGSGGSTGGGSAPPPPIVPPTLSPPTYTPQRPVVNPGDTGQLLASLHVVIREPDETGSTPETLTVQATNPTITVSHP